MKELWRRLRRRFWLRHVLLAAVALTAGGLALISYETGALSALERQAIDAQFTIRGRKPAGNTVTIVALDPTTMEALAARPPIPRIYYAQLLDILRAAHPRLIGLDVQFTGKTDRRDDDALLATIARDGPILLTTHDTSQGPILVPADVRNPPGAVISSAAAPTDADGVVRRMLYAQFDTETLAVRAAEMLRGRPVSRRFFPADQAWIDFRGPPGTFATYPMINVLQRRVPDRAFSGKVVLVGISDPQQKDIYVTAASSVPMAGVEIQANSLMTILDGFPLQPLSNGIEVALLFVLAAFPALVSLRLAALYVLLAAIGALFVLLLATQWAFDSGKIVSVPDPILALSLGAAGAVAADSYVTARQLRKLHVVLPSDFFISYRRLGSETIANLLRDSLVRKFSVFMDTDAIDAGEEWPRRIEEEIAACHAMLVVIGPEWLDAKGEDGLRLLDDPEDWVRREIEAGLARDEIAVVPVLHDRARAPQPERLPDAIKQLAKCQAVELTGRNLDRWIEALSESIQQGTLKRQQRLGHLTRTPGSTR